MPKTHPTSDNEIAAGRAPLPAFSALDDDSREAEMGAALAGVRALTRRLDMLTDALTSCILRLEDVGQGNSETAQYARSVLRMVGR